MTATDELRVLLDERGVEHEDKHTELVPGVSEWDSTWWRGIAGLEFHAVSDETCGREGCVYINSTYLTPEQAIAATLGKQPARLTAEQVRELIAPHLDARPTFDFGRHGAVWIADFQAIADELNATLGRGTCKPTEEDCCPICGEDLVRCNLGIGKLGGAVELDPPIYHNYCPNCGVKVVEQ